MKPKRQFMKSLWFPTALSAMMLLVGCETTTETVKTDPKNYPAREVKGYSREGGSQATKSGVLPANGTSDVVYEDNLVRLEKEYLSGSTVGQPIDYKIIVTAKRAVTNVEVDEFLPKTLKFDKSTPKASMNKFGMPSWDMEALKAGQQETISVSVIPKDVGTYEVCSVVTAQPLICLPLTVGMPKLMLAKSGPGWAELGEEVTWNVSVTNTGTATAKDVIIRDDMPKGFTATSPLTKNVGDLAPGESASMVVTARSNQKGSFTNVAYAKHASGAEKSASSPVSVEQSQIAITKSGPKNGYIFVGAPYTITVTNTGTTELTDVVVTDSLPNGAVIHGKVASSGEVYDKTGGKKFMPPVFDPNRNIYGYWKKGGNSLTDDTADEVVWKAGSLAPGQSKTFTVTMSASRPMTTTNNAVVTAQGPGGQTAGDQAATSMTASAPEGGTGSASTAKPSVAKSTVTGKPATPGKVGGQMTKGNKPVKVASAPGPKLRETASATTVWKAVPGIHTGISDNVDPIQIGQETTYTVIALNQSGYDTFPVQGQKVIVGEGLTIKSVSDGGKVNGNEVTFGPVNLAPGREVARTITVTGDKPGTTTTRVETIVNFRKTPVLDQESTTVYQKLTQSSAYKFQGPPGMAGLFIVLYL